MSFVEIMLILIVSMLFLIILLVGYSDSKKGQAIEGVGLELYEELQSAQQTMKLIGEVMEKGFNYIGNFAKTTEARITRGAKTAAKNTVKDVIGDVAANWLETNLGGSGGLFSSLFGASQEPKEEP